MKTVSAVIRLEVPDFQIGSPVTVYFKDTMKKNGVCDELIRCKDCKWFEMPRFGERGFCKCLDMVTGTVWYCADGERK